MEWTKKQYNSYYNSYMPWIEDKVLGYWGENKTSYTAKGPPSPRFSLRSTTLQTTSQTPSC